MQNIVVFGPPGSGKGTQSLRIVRRYGFSHLSTGEMLRNEISLGTERGRQVEELMQGGNLVPDEIVLKIAMEHALKHKGGKGVVFDGFPRTLYQAQVLDRFLSRNDIAIGLVIALDISRDEIYDRILGRGSDSGRPDDSKDIITHRIDVYRNRTCQVIEYYEDQNKLSWVSGMAPVDKVFGRICKVIEKRFPGLKPQPGN